MPSRRPRQINLTIAPAEALEARIVMSAQPLADFVLDYYVSGDADTSASAITSVDAANDVVSFDAIQTTLTEANALSGLDAVRNAYGFTGSGQTVAVIDTGIAYDHAALGGGFGESYRVVGGWDFTGENDANPYDDGGAGSHGTHVAGIIGGNDSDYLGVAPDVDIVALRVFDDVGAGYFEWVENALQWVHDNRNAFANPITAVNLSLGVAWNDDVVPEWATLEDEFAQLEADGIFIGVAAGNSFTSYQEVGLGYPAVSQYVVPVSSVDDDGTLSYFSQRSDRVIAAPGRNIVSTVPDYAGDNNGIADDFASFSGTSMAAPYVTGTSLLIREAFAFAGQPNVTQDQIYDVMRDTADSVWDDATDQYYSRLNVSAALDSIMPSDDYGSTIAAASNVGSVGSGVVNVSGMIERMDDVDYFRFTASATGEASFTLTSDGKSGAVWATDGDTSARSVDAEGLHFQVVAGEEYVIGVGAGSGVSRYAVEMEIQAAAVDWGVIDFAQFDDVRFDGGDAWYSFQASQDGILTVQALFRQASGDIDLELYDANGNKIASSTSGTNNERVEIDAAAGETFLVRVVGSNDSVDLRVTNLVERIGDTIVVSGTSGNDRFLFRAEDRYLVSINGVQYRFASSDVSTVRFDGGAGMDRAVLTGSAADDGVTLDVGAGTLQSDHYRVDVVETENIRVNSGGGHDVATLLDSSQSDLFVGRPQSSFLRGPGFVNRVTGFSEVHARASAGGEKDRAVLYDSAGDDQFTAYPDRASMEGDGFLIAAVGFDQVSGYATAGGTNDQAMLYDSAGNDVYVGWPTSSVLRGDGFYNVARGFDRVFADSSSGGDDRAFFNATSASDVFEDNSEYSLMVALNGAFYNYAQGFDRDNVLVIDRFFSELGDPA